MNAMDLINAIEQVLDVGDTLDNAGIGAQTLTGGKNTTRQVCRLELGQFLLYIADGASTITDAQASLLNIVMVGLGSSISAAQFKKMAGEVGIPKPDKSITFPVFRHADQALAKQNGTSKATCTGILLSTYETFGQLMLGFNQNPVSKMRYDRLIEQYRAMASAPAPDAEEDQASSRVFRYDDRLSFALPDGYDFIDETNDKGDRTASIGVNPSEEDGEKKYERKYNVLIRTEDEADAEESVLDIFENQNWSAEINCRLGGDPEGHLVISTTSRAMLGFQFRASTAELRVELSRKEAVALSSFSLDGGDDEDIYASEIEQLRVIWESMIIGGRKAVVGDMDAESITAPMREKAAEDAKRAEVALSAEVRQEGNAIVVGNRWRMELPYGVRMRHIKHDDSNRFDTLFFDVDRRSLGMCVLGTTVQEQDEILSGIQSALMSSVLDREKRLHEQFAGYLRNDEKMAVSLHCHLNVMGGTIFEIRIIEKEPVRIETRMVMEIHYIIEDFEHALEAIQESNLSMEHPFGDGWVRYYETIARMAASIAPVDDVPEAVELSEPRPLGGDISARFPMGYKPYEGSSDRIIYMPTAQKPTEADMKRADEFPYCIIQDYGKTDLPVKDEERHMAGPLGVRIGSICYMTVRKAHSAFAVELGRNVTDDAIKVLYLAPRNSDFAPDVVLFTTDGYVYQWHFASDSGLSGHRLLQAARAFYDGLRCGEGGEAVPLAYPQVDDIYHEHLTLTMSGQYTTHRDADFTGQPIRMLMEKHGGTGEEAYALMAMPDDDYALDAEARRLATVFRLEEERFDPYGDTEAMIRRGMFQDVKMLHALRTVAWTVCCMADREGRTPDSYSFEELKKISEPLEANHVNYGTESWCSGLCSHYDWHVFYVPDAYIGSDCENTTDLRRLCGKENRGGNSVSFLIPGLGLGGLGAMHSINEIIGRNEETLESLEALRKDLVDLLPVMQTIHDGFMRDRDRSQPLEGLLAEALTAWCALAIAAKEPFYSEEAADTPEADAGLDGPLARPADEDAGIASKPQPFTVTSRKRPTPPLPAGEVLDLGGATVIAPGQFAGNMTLRNIIIPEGVTEIGEQAFNTCMFLETVALPKSLKKIGKMAFMSCRSLRQIEIPEGVEEIDNHAFGATNNLKEVHLPDSLKTVNQYIFGAGGDSPYATAYMSGELARRLQENSPNPRWMSAVYARRYVIGGVGYENMYDFWKPEGAFAVSGGYHQETEEEHEARRNAETQAYCDDMKAACREGKTLQEMIDQDASTNHIRKDTFFKAFPEAKEEYDLFISHLDRDAKVVFQGKRFVLSGLDHRQAEVLTREIEARGGILHSTMVKKADYLVVALSSNGFAKVKKALEWREKHAHNLIISDYQLWQALVATEAESPKAAEPVKSDGAAGASITQKAKETADASSSPAPAAGESSAQSSATPKSPAEQGHGLEDYLSHDEIILKGKTFAFSGITVQSWDTLADRLEMAGGFLRQDVIGKTDYLVVRDIHGNANAKTNKAMELIGSGKALKIILLEDLERALNAAGATTEALRERNLKRAEEARRKREEEEERKRKQPQMLDLHGARTVEEHEFEFGNRNGEFIDVLHADILELPEGLEQILGNGFAWCNMKEVRLPRSLRLLDGNAFLNCSDLEKVVFQEGLTEIGDLAFGGKNRLTDVYLPDSLVKMGNAAFAEEFNRDSASHITLHMSGSMARRLRLVDPAPGQPWAIPTERVKAVVIDGERYDSVAAYQAEVKRQEQAEHERVRREQEEARKAAERKRLQGEIDVLTAERDSLKGIFAGMKRKKMQKQIDDLNEQLRRL